MLDVESLKKVELHCHVDGLLNPALLKGISKDSEILRLVPNLDSLCPTKDLDDWLERYCPAIEPAVGNRGDLLLVMLAQYLRTLKAQNVVYSEIMLSSFTFQHRDIADQIALSRKFCHIAEEIGGDEMEVKFLLAIGRTKNRKKMERCAERILELARAGIVCGVAVGGLEEENTIKPYQDLFSMFRAAGLGIEIHAGEWTGPDFVWEALEYGYANRIGHGLATFEDPVLVNHVKEHGIHLEFCPTSNMLLTRYKTIADHPIKNAMAEGISFSINTDDPGPFCTDINREFTIVANAFNLTGADFEQIFQNSLSAAFGRKNL